MLSTLLHCNSDKKYSGTKNPPNVFNCESRFNQSLLTSPYRKGVPTTNKALLFKESSKNRNNIKSEIKINYNESSIQISILDLLVDHCGDKNIRERANHNCECTKTCGSSPTYYVGDFL